MKSLCTAALVLCAASASMALAGQPGESYPSTAYYSSPALLPVSDGGAAAPAYPAYATAYQAGSKSNISSVSLGGGEAMPAPAPSNSVYNEAASSGWGDASSCGCGGDSCNACGCGCCTTWFASVGGLIMTRDNPNPTWTTFQTNNNPNQLLNTHDAQDSWAGGAEIRIGRCCNCCTSWEAIYWGTWGMNGEASIYSPTNELSAVMDMGNGVLINGNPATDYYDNAREHQITREDTFHNAEINWLVAASSNVQWIAGFRYFNFNENLTFASLSGSAPAGDHIGDDPAETAYLSMQCDNNLYGFQIGARADLGRGPCHLFVMPKVGIFDNHITSRAYLHDGNFVEGFDIHDTKDDVAFLAEIDVGLSYDINCHWNIYGGYRAVALTGVALSDNQFPAFLAASDELADVDSNGSLILHGAFAGVGYSW